MMTTIFLNRLKSNAEATLGVMYFETDFFCFVLEDEAREKKVAGETRIPAGRYRIEKCFQSGLLNRMRSSGWYKKNWIPTICDVPGFTNIRIHSGNTEKHTDGCPLLGFSANIEDFTIGSSRKAILEFVEKLEPCFNGGEVWINVTDEG